MVQFRSIDILAFWPLLIASAGALMGGAAVILMVIEPLPPAALAPSTASRLGPRVHALEKAQEALAVESSASLEPYVVSGAGVLLQDGLTFGPDGAVPTRLAGLVGPSREAVCQDEERHLWACGLQARAALNNLIRRSEVRCVPLSAATEGVLEARCSVDGQDLGTELVKAGFARGKSRGLEFTAAEANAERNKLGLWNGGWAIRQ